MDQNTKMNLIESFQGKRNTAITLIIPPQISVKKVIEPIQRQVKAIKHSNKRNQITQVINCILDNNSKIEYNDPGIILCAGLGNDNKVIYTSIIPNTSISNMEYYYDDTFHIDLIRKYIHSNSVIFIPCAKLHTSEISAKIEANSSAYAIGNDIPKAFDMDLLKNIFYFGENIIPKKLLDDAIKHNKTIYKFNRDDVNRKDFQKKYGDIVGELYYPYDFN